MHLSPHRSGFGTLARGGRRYGEATHLHLPPSEKATTHTLNLMNCLVLLTLHVPVAARGTARLPLGNALPLVALAIELAHGEGSNVFDARAQRPHARLDTCRGCLGLRALKVRLGALEIGPLAAHDSCLVRHLRPIRLDRCPLVGKRGNQRL